MLPSLPCLSTAPAPNQGTTPFPKSSHPHPYHTAMPAHAGGFFQVCASREDALDGSFALHKSIFPHHHIPSPLPPGGEHTLPGDILLFEGRHWSCTVEAVSNYSRTESFSYHGLISLYFFTKARVSKSPGLTYIKRKTPQIHQCQQRWQSLSCYLAEDRCFHAALMLSSYTYKTKILCQ